MNKDFKENSELKRIDKNYIIDEIKGIFNLDKGFIFTAKNLLIKPGKTIREYIFINRKKYVKPIIFLILTSLFLSLLLKFTGIKYSIFNIDSITFLKGKIRSQEIGNWSQNNLGYSQLLMGIFIGFWIKLFFKQHKYNIYEILVALSFILGEAFLIMGISIIIIVISSYSGLPTNLTHIIGTIIFVVFYFGYIIWAIGQFFGETKIINYIKSLLTYVLGNITYLVVLAFLAFLLKFI